MASRHTALSPTVTHLSSRPPTPSGDRQHVVELDLPRPRRRASRSPPHIFSDNATDLPFRHSDDLPRRTSLQQPSTQSPSSSRRPVIAQHSPPTSSPRPKDADEGREPEECRIERGDKRPSLSLPTPLLSDVSLYTNPHLTPENDSTTLEELAHLVRLSRYQERKRLNTRIRLQRSLISTALSSRLTRCGDMAHKSLFECFCQDEKRQFASLYNAVQDVRTSCDELRRYALLDPEMEALQPPGLGSSESLDTPTGSVHSGNTAARSMIPFLSDISASARETLLGFLMQIRTNPDYLVTRLSALNQAELAVLTRSHQGAEPTGSVLPGGHSSLHRTGSITGRRQTQGTNPGHIERLLSFQRHDPLSGLLYTCFANSAGPDSAEDRRRTEVWATACARLVDRGNPNLYDPLLMAVMNAWTTMRDWSGRSNMEWYLMNIMADGAFILDRADDSHGTLFNDLHSRDLSKERAAMEEFYAKAVDELFEVLDDEDGTGVPEGILELGYELLERVGSHSAESTRQLITKFLFNVWLRGVMVFPESHGMLAETHITGYGRDAILKTVYNKAMEHIKEAAPWGNPTRPTGSLSKIRGHVDNIWSRFKTPRSQRSAAKLLPARSITSLRETVEVHPYLVISPADLVTLVSALFPDRRPRSARSGSIRSVSTSVTGGSSFSQPLAMTSMRPTFDSASVLSTSASSVVSDTTTVATGLTSREPLLQDHSFEMPSRLSPPVPHHPQQLYEEDGYRLRLAVHEMTQTLGSDVVQGSCHPCAERWAVLFISADGTGLSPQLTYDPDDDLDEDESSSTTDTDDDEVNEGPELDRDYHQLRDSILKLVEEYEIPQTPVTDRQKPQTFSNRASSLKKYRSKNKVITAEKTPSRNPYRQHWTEAEPDQASSQAGTRAHHASGHDQIQKQESLLVAMLVAAQAQAKAQSDFVSAHLYWKTLQRLNALTLESLRQDGFSTLLNIFSRGPRDSIRRSAAAIEEYDAWLVWQKQSQERHDGLIESMMRRLRALRDKMWYVSDVKHSAEYTDTSRICSVLQTMGSSRRQRNQKRGVNPSRTTIGVSLHSADAQTRDMVMAQDDQGGPNKLSNESAEVTKGWLQHSGIENFCRGEERIHRFCFQVQECIGKLVGQSISAAPALWSSELFSRDKQVLGIGSKRDSQLSFDSDSASVISDHTSRFVPGSTTRPNSIARDLRSMSGHNYSQHSLDSTRYSSRASTIMSESYDSQDYFGAASPVRAIDTSRPFWSPFTASTASSVISRSQTPTTGITSTLSSTLLYPQHRQLPSQSGPSIGRPGTSASSNETIHQQRQSDETDRFLNELRQTVTGLLLSDLGTKVFATGSETDSWFGGLGQEFIERRESRERREKDARSRARPRVIEKKRSFGNLRGVGDTNNRSPDYAESQNESSATSDTVSSHSRANARKNKAPEFPFKKAYQRLLRMFRVHPNPYTKLNALYELENLIIASLTAGGSRRPRTAFQRPEFFGPVAEDHYPPGHVRTFEDVIGNVKERRSHATQSPTRSPTGGYGQSRPADARSVMSYNPANTENITNVLQSLFRDPTMRPKTLFRDLQFIASLVPPSTLDKTERGKAFWDTGLAALSLKQEVCRDMVEVADQVVKLYTEKRKNSSHNSASAAASNTHTSARVGVTTLQPAPPSTTPSSSSSAMPAQAQAQPLAPGPALAPAPELPERAPSPEDLTRVYTLGDAARMYVITAREGDHAAQRELGLFYMTTPEVVEQRATLPLSRPSDVFKRAIMDRYGHGHGRGGGSGVVDAALMCVAYHWMEAAELGGDDVARNFLAQNEIGL